MLSHGAVLSRQSQVSATISTTTKDALDRFTEQRGLKKNYVVEQALLFFMEARRALPEEAFIPARVVLDEEGFDAVASLLEHPPEPTPALRELLGGD